MCRGRRSILRGVWTRFLIGSVRFKVVFLLGEPFCRKTNSLNVHQSPCKNESSRWLRRIRVGGYVNAGSVTEVAVQASAYDERAGDDGGCGEMGCMPMLAYDGVVDEAESRWSCAEMIVPGQCELLFSLKEPQDVKGIKVYLADEDFRRLKVSDRITKDRAVLRAHISLLHKPCCASSSFRGRRQVYFTV